MWVEAVDVVLQRLREKGCPFSRIKGISGSGQQHGSVYWSHAGPGLLASLNPEETLVSQLAKAFAHPFSPNWQDGSTQEECDKFDAELGSPEKLAQVTGSKAHHVCSLPCEVTSADDITEIHGSSDHAYAQEPSRCLLQYYSNHTCIVFPRLDILGQDCPI